MFEDMFLVKIASKETFLINRICSIFHMKSNYFGPIIRKKLKKNEKLKRRRLS